MLRITHWRMTGTPAPNLTPHVTMQAFQEMCTTLERVRGAGKVRFFFGDGGIVTVGEPENYAAADTLLTSREAQMAVGKVLQLGYGIHSDQFLLEPQVVRPFTEQPAAVGASRN